MNPSKHGRAIAVAALLVTAVLLLFLWARHGFGERDAVTVLPQPHQARPGSLPVPGSAPTAAAKPQGGALPTAPAQATSLSEELERLIRSRRPEAAYSAAKILNGCVESRWAQEEAAKVANPEVRKLYDQYGTPQEKCGDILPGQLSQRFTLVIAAADARVPGAYGMLLRLLNDNPNSQELEQAFKRVLQSNIVAADPTTLITQYQALANCSDPPKCTGQDLYQALTLWTAYWQVSGKPAPDNVTKFLVDRLGPDRAGQAAAAGNALVEEARRKK